MNQCLNFENVDITTKLSFEYLKPYLHSIGNRAKGVGKLRHLFIVDNCDSYLLICDFSPKIKGPYVNNMTDLGKTLMEKKHDRFIMSIPVFEDHPGFIKIGVTVIRTSVHIMDNIFKLKELLDCVEQNYSFRIISHYIISTKFYHSNVDEMNFIMQTIKNELDDDSDIVIEDCQLDEKQNLNILFCFS